MIRIAAAAAILLVAAGTANAACIVPQPPAFSTHPSLGTMTSDQAKIEGGCLDNTPIGQNNPAPGNFSSLTVNGTPVGQLVLPTSCVGIPDGALYNNSGVPAICGVVVSSGALGLNAGVSLSLNSGGKLLLNSP